MCGPAALPIAAAVVAVAGTAMSGIQQAQAQRYQARVADMNASLARDQGKDAMERGLLADRDTQRDTAQLLGAQRASMAANGLDLGFGSAAQVLSDTRMIGREDVDRTRRNTFAEVQGFDINALNYDAEARAQRQAARATMINTAFDSVGTALSKASQIQQAGGGGGSFKKPNAYGIKGSDGIY